MFGSDLVVLGGRISKCGDILIDVIKRIIRLKVLEMISKKVKIVKIGLDENNAVSGIVTNFIDSLFIDNKLNIFNLINKMNTKNIFSENIK